MFFQLIDKSGVNSFFIASFFSSFIFTLFWFDYTNEQFVTFGLNNSAGMVEEKFSDLFLSKKKIHLKPAKSTRFGNYNKFE